jgi:6-phosphogluconolactonase
MLNNNWLVFKNDILLSNALAQEILEIAEESIKLKGNFTIVLAGGNSPMKLYKILRNSKSNWDKWSVYIGDERCLPMNDNDRNDQAIMKIWLDHSSIKKHNIHPIKAELGMLAAQLDYENTLDKIDRFDVVLLSVGEDGHTASLFPNHQYSKNRSVILEYNSPKDPAERISMSPDRLSKARYVFKIIIGETKKIAVDLWLKGVPLPINQINGDIEKMYICTNAMPKDSR